jgi:hypothetical protein
MRRSNTVTQASNTGDEVSFTLRTDYVVLSYFDMD